MNRASSASGWCFTLNNYSEADRLSIISEFKKDLTNRWIVGKEKGAQGTPHLQGYIKTMRRIRPMERYKLCLNAERKTRIHWEAARGTLEDNYNYCSKEGDFETNILAPEPLKLIDNLYPWQKEMEEIIKAKPDDRTIHWVWDPEGNTGKTQLCKYLSAKYNAMLMNGPSKDILYMGALHESQAYMLDLPRADEEFVPYKTIETMKNDCWMTGKYEGERVLRNSPHILVFANFPPKMSALSRDRWHIAEIRNKHLHWISTDSGGAAAGPADDEAAHYVPNSSELQMAHDQMYDIGYGRWQ